VPEATAIANDPWPKRQPLRARTDTSGT